MRLDSPNLADDDIVGRRGVGLVEYEALVAGALEHRAERHDADRREAHDLQPAVLRGSSSAEWRRTAGLGRARAQRAWNLLDRQPTLSKRRLHGRETGRAEQRKHVPQARSIAGRFVGAVRRLLSRREILKCVSAAGASGTRSSVIEPIRRTSSLRAGVDRVYAGGVDQNRILAPTTRGNDQRELSSLTSWRPSSTSQSTSDRPPMKRSWTSPITSKGPTPMSTPPVGPRLIAHDLSKIEPSVLASSGASTGGTPANVPEISWNRLMPTR